MRAQPSPGGDYSSGAGAKRSPVAAKKEAK